MKRYLLSYLFCVLALLPGLSAQDNANGPTSLVISYRAVPEHRAAFRTYLESAGARQFAKWQHDGVFQKYQILFGSYAATNAVDAVVILDFATYTDLTRWKEIERRLPGGLSADAIKLAHPESACLADVLGRRETVQRDPAKAACFIAFYDVLTDWPKYLKYLEGYTFPQMQGWIDEGVLGAYAMYGNQNAAGAPWDVMLVLEYKDQASLAQREMVKNKVRQKLSTDPVFKSLASNKTGIRNETSVLIADPILPVTP